MPEKEAVFIQTVGYNGAKLYRLNPPFECRNDWSSGFVGERLLEYVVLAPFSNIRVSNTLIFSTMAMGDGVRMVALDAMCGSIYKDHERALAEIGYTLVETPKIEREIVATNPLRIVRLED